MYSFRHVCAREGLRKVEGGGQMGDVLGLVFDKYQSGHLPPAVTPQPQGSVRPARVPMGPLEVAFRSPASDDLGCPLPVAHWLLKQGVFRFLLQVFDKYQVGPPFRNPPGVRRATGRLPCPYPGALHGPYGGGVTPTPRRPFWAKKSAIKAVTGEPVQGWCRIRRQ